MRSETEFEQRVREGLRAMADELPGHGQVDPRVLGRARRGAMATGFGSVVVAGLLVAAVVVGVGHLRGPATPPHRPVSGGGPWAALERPLHFPTVTGSACPVSPLVVRRPHGGNWTGSGQVTFRGGGPVYVTGDIADRTLGLRMLRSLTPEGWYQLKTLWAGTSAAHGPLLIRVAQLSGTGGVGLAGNNVEAPTGLSLRLSEGGLGNGWWSDVTVTFVRSPGCYAYQIDGANFSEVIVFRVVR